MPKTLKTPKSRAPHVRVQLAYQLTFTTEEQAENAETLIMGLRRQGQILPRKAIVQVESHDPYHGVDIEMSDLSGNESHCITSRFEYWVNTCPDVIEVFKTVNTTSESFVPVSHAD